ncbi:MAG: sodium ion-translocating decarboxylase subunit beta, partial [Saprospiraceae bacterium]|nr:sodium ion-translocating decarboxylase subunit beta [Saprospiraceae bacterium]
MKTRLFRATIPALLFLAASPVAAQSPGLLGDQSLLESIRTFYEYTGFANAHWGNFLMIGVGLFFIWLAIRFGYEPLLLVPIGLGILLGNIPFRQDAGLQIGIYEPGSVLNYLYFG